MAKFIERSGASADEAEVMATFVRRIDSRTEEFSLKAMSFLNFAAFVLEGVATADEAP